MEVVDAVRARRARRALAERVVEKDKIDALIEAVRLSASCFNNQPWHMVVVEGAEALGAVKAALSKGNVWATKAPAIMVVAAKEDGDCQLSDKRNYFLFDCGLGLGQMLLRATELGLVAHPIAGYDPVKVKQALGMPHEYTVITLVICGYPGDDASLLSDKQREAEKSRPERKPISENFFLDSWDSPYG